MKPTTKTDLAINGMAELASHNPQKPLALAVLADRQNISLSYLEQVFAALRRHGLVISVRGPGGGYLLARPADQIRIGDIVVALDADEQPSKPIEEGTRNCPKSQVEQFWSFMAERIKELYDAVTLQDVLDGHFSRRSSLPETAPQAAE